MPSPAFDQSKFPPNVPPQAVSGFAGPNLSVAARDWIVIWMAAALLALAVLLAWSNSFRGPFILDDLPAIADNPTVKNLHALDRVFSPPNDGQTVTGRPLVNLSFAINYAISGANVWSYHWLNLAIHLGAALALFGLVRRTLTGAVGRKLLAGAPLAPVSGQNPRDGPVGPGPRASAPPATWVAFMVALLWALHPLQTASITYIAQRAESLCALFYLLTLYCFIRGAAATRPWWWYGLAVAACLAGMASKEVMVSAPLMVLLYDRTFVAGGFRTAWQRRWGFYIALAATWILLIWLVFGSGNRGGTAGFGLPIAAELATSWTYLLTQCGAIVHYLRLCVWPHPLILDYGFPIVAGMAEVWWQGLLLLLLLGATIWALIRRPVWGFLGVWFFAILAPSSSFVPVVTETKAEHRMYLPLAALVVLAVCAVAARGGRRGLASLLLVAVALGVMTHERNEYYRSSLSLWFDNALQQPGNARVHNNLGLAYGDLKRLPEAVAEEEAAIKLKPDYGDAQLHLATYLEEMGRFPEALPHYQLALQLKPNEGKYHNNYAFYFVRTGHLPEAAAEYAQAIRLCPDFAPAHSDYGNVLTSLGRAAEAAAQYEAAIRLDPSFAQAQNNYGNLLGTTGHLPEAITHYAAAVQIQPDFIGARVSLGVALFLNGQKTRALQMLEQAVQLAPDNAEARAKLEAVRQELKK